MSDLGSRLQAYDLNISGAACDNRTPKYLEIQCRFQNGNVVNLSARRIFKIINFTTFYLLSLVFDREILS